MDDVVSPVLTVVQDAESTGRSEASSPKSSSPTASATNSTARMPSACVAAPSVRMLMATVSPSGPRTTPVLATRHVYTPANGAQFDDEHGKKPFFASACHEIGHGG
jgi:hypothetical protein